MIPTSDVSQLQMQLGLHERLLWSGRPRGGVFLRRGDVVLIPLTALMVAFSAFWMFGAYWSGAPAIFIAFGAPFVLFSLYHFGGRFFWDAAKRKRTLYGLTSERVIIISQFPTESLDWIPLGAIPQLAFTRHQAGWGTITFGPEHRWQDRLPYGSIGGASRDLSLRFDYINEPDRVHGLLREAMNAAS